jgi:type I restriction enzyme S subunit
MKAGWEVKALGDICDFQNGFAFKSNLFLESGFPIIRISNIQNQQVIEDDLVYFNKSDYKENFDKYQVNKGDILIAMSGGTTGKIGVNTTESVFYLNQRVGKFIPKACLINQYLYYLLLTKTEESLIISAGSAQPNLSTEQIKNFQVPLPSTQEQQRIVAILDQAFEGIAKARANAEQNLQNARALFESHLQSVFTQRGEGWKEMVFDELIESNVIGLTKSSREQGSEKAYPYVKMNNITRDNRFDFTSFTCVDATDEEVKKFSLQDGDFLFNTRNSYELVGKSCIYESEKNVQHPVLFNNNIMRVRFKSDVLAEYVLIAFSSKDVVDELNALKSGTTNVSAIYFKDLKSLKIRIPSFEVQKKIASETKLISTKTQRLEALYQRKIACLDELKKSLLQQAFAGEL